MSEQAPSSSPVVLFDGVCNLCDASVRWIIDHDRKGVFRFAPLDSEAGRTALRGSGATARCGVPDSVVLIDAAGVHTRSEAVIRIARRLGLPWSMAMLAYIMPRVVRDALYAWVARNRYRWFGRQNTCMVPSEEVRSRFLAGTDAIPTAPVTERGESEERRAFTSWLHRVVLAYFIAYIVPFPFGLIPGTGIVASWFGQAKQSVVVWIAKQCFSIEITVFPGGSGDTTYNYVELVLFAGVALVVGTATTLIRRGKVVSARASDAATVYLRYYLAMVLLGYGWHKVLPVQMPFPGPDRLLSTYGDASPMGLLWTFIGASPAYQVFAGLGEVAAGSLLLWRRTTLLGALIGAGVMLNVVMLNFCYDVPVKLFSSHLLLMLLFLIMPHAARLAAVLVLNLPAAPVVLRPFPVRARWIRWILGLAKATAVIGFAVAPAIRNLDLLTMYGPWRSTASWHGVYRVEEFSRDGVSGGALEDSQRWVRVGLNSMGVGAFQTADGRSQRNRIEVDQVKQSMRVTRREPPAVWEFTFAMPEVGVVMLEGVVEGTSMRVRMRKTEDGAMLTSRGFHWINEFPLNR